MLAPLARFEALPLRVLDGHPEERLECRRRGPCTLVEGGEPGPCGWLKDRYGFSWQVTPTALYKMLDDSDSEKVQRVTAAFMQVNGRKFDIAELEAAFDGRN